MNDRFQPHASASQQVQSTFDVRVTSGRGERRRARRLCALLSATTTTHKSNSHTLARAPYTCLHRRPHIHLAHPLPIDRARAPSPATLAAVSPLSHQARRSPHTTHKLHHARPPPPTSHSSTAPPAALPPTALSQSWVRHCRSRSPKRYASSPSRPPSLPRRVVAGAQQPPPNIAASPPPVRHKKLPTQLPRTDHVPARSTRTRAKMTASRSASAPCKAGG